MNARRFLGAVCTLALFWLPAPAGAAPPIWEPGFGPALDMLTGKDEGGFRVDLSFSFPFDGTLYTDLWVSTNGELQLGSLGNDLELDYDHWEYLEELLDDGAPSVAGFSSDLDLSTTGTIHLNDFGDRAVFTWNEVGTNANNTALLTFQITLHDDGTIVLGYNGILDDPSEDLLTDLSEGIVVGVTAGDIPQPTDPGILDLSNPPFAGGTTIHERWCYLVADSCGFFGQPGSLPGATNDAFDLDQLNVIFTPTPGGFVVPEPDASWLWALTMLTIGIFARSRRSCSRPERLNWGWNRG